VIAEGERTLPPRITAKTINEREVSTTQYKGRRKAVAISFVGVERSGVCRREEKGFFHRYASEKRNSVEDKLLDRENPAKKTENRTIKAGASGVQSNLLARSRTCLIVPMSRICEQQQSRDSAEEGGSENCRGYESESRDMRYLLLRNSGTPSQAPRLRNFSPL
jgi:hypothetical protein